MKLNIPSKIQTVLQQLESAGHEAFLVGGCVRDLLRKVEPKDWDITTSAKPEEILKVFPDAKYENDFGTVILPEKYIDSSQFTVHGSQSDSKRGAGKKEGEIEGEKLKLLSGDVKIKEETKKQLLEIAKKYLQTVECPAHGTIHSDSVTKTALTIADDFSQVDKNIIEVLAQFHDAGRAIGEPKEHVKNSQQIKTFHKVVQLKLILKT